jgi:hypothetical protein
MNPVVHRCIVHRRRDNSYILAQNFDGCIVWGRSGVRVIVLNSGDRSRSNWRWLRFG